MPPKKQKSGYQKVKTKDKKLLEAAATAVHQKSIQECFRKHDQKYGSSLGNSVEIAPAPNENNESTTLPQKENAFNVPSPNDSQIDEIDNSSRMDTIESEQAEFVLVPGEHCADNVMSPFEIPDKNPQSICAFLKLHPVQPYTCQFSQLFTRSLNGNKTIHRSWLSYDSTGEKFFCYVCMAFGKDSANVFQKGVALNPKHCTTRVKEHEGISSHISAAESFIRFDRSRSISDLVNYQLHSARLVEVKNNQEVVKRIIEWILCVGRQGIPYRGAFESTKFYNDPSVNHGNLLEILMTASKQDALLKGHLEKCGKFEFNDPDKTGPRGRGAKITFLSKTTFNKLIDEIGGAIKKRIVDEVKASGLYSLMADGTQDISGHEQCSVVVRYVNSATFKVEERSIGLIRLTDTSGEGYLEAIVPYLRKLGVDPLLMISCSFDGAMNMQSDDVGLQGRLKKINENLVYTWCYAHKLNLSVSTSVTSVISAKNLFGLLQSTHNFCSESYKRTIQWEAAAKELKGHKKLIRFQNFGKTRWYSHDRSLRKIFNSFNDIDIDVYIALLKFLYNVKTGKNFDSKTSFEASALLHGWTKMETLLTAFTFLKIFDILGPTSKYLQTKGLNMMAAVKMVQSATEDIKNLRSSFQELTEKAVWCARKVNNELKNKIDVYVEEVIPVGRIRRIKRRDGELASDEPFMDELEKYRVNQFLVLCDTTYQSLCERFSGENNDLIEEMSFFHPDSFPNLAKLKNLEFKFLSRVLKIDSAELVKELKHFANNFRSFSTVIDFGEMNFIDDEDESDVEEDNRSDDSSDEEDLKKTSKKCKTSHPCNKCLACCFAILCKLNLHISTYTNLHRAYEYFMTLPCTEVACERAFSKLKLIKSRLRSALTQEHVDSLLLMYVERELTHELDIDEIVKSFARTSNELKRLLIE